MSFTVEAVYADGCLKLSQPLPFKEHEKVTVTLQALRRPNAPTREEAERIVRQSYGLLRWTGDAETLRRVAEDPEFSVLES